VSTTMQVSPVARRRSLPEAPAAPFDAVAARYDAEFSERRLGRWLRQAVWERLGAAFRPGDRVLELGCGTGEDALWLARRGILVTATDVSPRMLAVARAKIAAAGLEERVSLVRLDLRDLEALRSGTDPSSATFDGAFSNFGALNCLAERRTLAAALAARVRAGGRVILVVMSPLCPWEVGWFLAHGDMRGALRRFRFGARAHLADGAGLKVWYPSPSTLRREFAPYFRPLATVGIGTLLPPAHLAHLVDRWPRLFARIAALERRVSGRFPWSWLTDHYLLVLERR
jgi:ubiquinone/menaquinone biosynthesis C-methylase UbiE